MSTSRTTEPHYRVTLNQLPINSFATIGATSYHVDTFLEVHGVPGESTDTAK